MRLVDQRMCRQKCRLFYTMFIIKMSNFGTKENFCEVYNSSLKFFIFIHYERDTRTFFCQVSDVDHGLSLWEYDQVWHRSHRSTSVL